MVFKIVLPLSMLKKHTESPSGRVFGGHGQQSKKHMRCQVTPPSSSGQRRSTDTPDDREVVVAEIDGND
jgi:hypothetical protein